MDISEIIQRLGADINIANIASEETDALGDGFFHGGGVGGEPDLFGVEFVDLFGHNSSFCLRLVTRLFRLLSVKKPEMFHKK